MSGVDVQEMPGWTQMGNLFWTCVLEVGLLGLGGGGLLFRGFPPPLGVGPKQNPPLKFPPCEKKFPPQLMPQRWFSSIFAVGNVFFKGKTRLEAQKFSPAALRGQKTSKTM